MPRAAVLLFSLFVVATSTTTARSQTGAPAGYSVVSRANVYAGVEYVKLSKPKVPVIAHVAHVLPGARVDLRVLNANGRISSDPRELETTSSMCGRARCIVGVNGDFHVAGAPAGGVVTESRMLRSPHPDRPQLTVTRDGRLVAGPLPWTGSITLGDGGQIPVSAVNAAPSGDGIALYTPDFGGSTADSARTELVVRANGPVSKLNQPTELDLIAIRSGAGPIPEDGAVLSGEGATAQRLRDLWAGHKAGASARPKLLVGSTVDAAMSLGVEPVVLRDGKRALPWRDPNVINYRQPHTLVGWNDEGHTYLVAVDGRQAASEGVTMAEAADFLLGLGVTDAVSLDGGGGTTFVAGAKVWNRPSDNDPVRPAEYEERGATNALVLMARPGAPLPPAAPPTPPTVIAPQAAKTPAATTGDETNGEPTGSTETPWAADTIGGLPLDSFQASEQLAAGELPIGPSLTGPGRQGRPAASLDQAAVTTDDTAAPPADRAGAPGQVGDDPSTAANDDLNGQVSLAALTSPAPEAATSDRRSQTPFNHLRMGAIGGALLLTAVAHQRRRRGPFDRLLDPVAPTSTRKTRKARRTAPSTRPTSATVPQPVNPKPAATKPAVVKPTVVKPTVVKPTVIKSAPAKPAPAKPAEPTLPAESTPAVKPAAAEKAAPEPLLVKKAEPKPAAPEQLASAAPAEPAASPIFRLVAPRTVPEKAGPGVAPAPVPSPMFRLVPSATELTIPSRELSHARSGGRGI